MTSTPPAHLTETPATEKQIDYIKSLAQQKDVGEHAEWLAAKLAGQMTKQFASKLIGRLKDMPAKPIDHSKPLRDITGEHGQQMLWNFPAGRYAIVNSDGDNDGINPIAFYHVTIGKEGGRWAGYYFVSRMASDEEYPVKAKAERTRVLKAIADNPLEAAQRYGREFKRCAICSKGLTRRLSREMGIGPVCAERVGMPHEHIDAIKHTLIAQGFDPEETI
jgi:hypothetical protein